MSRLVHTVLLVDDEEHVRRILSDALEGAGFSVLRAADYYEAIRLTINATLSLLIADVSLPGPNGCELALELRRQQPDLPCLFMSGYTGAEICKAYGIAISDRHFLGKPFLPVDVVNRARQILSNSARMVSRQLSPNSGNSRLPSSFRRKSTMKSRI